MPKRSKDIIYRHPIEPSDWLPNKKGRTKVMWVDVSPELRKYGVKTTIKFFSARRPIAYSTQSTLDWLKILAEQAHSWEEMLFLASGEGPYLRDSEAVEVIEKLIAAKVRFKGYFVGV